MWAAIAFAAALAMLDLGRDGYIDDDCRIEEKVELARVSRMLAQR